MRLRSGFRAAAKMRYHGKRFIGYAALDEQARLASENIAEFHENYGYSTTLLGGDVDYPSTIHPKFWTGDLHRPESDFTIDCSDFNLPATASTGCEAPVEMLRQMDEMFERVGLVWLRNTGLRTKEDMAFYANYILKDVMSYEGGANSREGLGENVYETGAPRQAWLHYHHEMAYLGQSCSKIGFFCTEAVEGKGWSFASDGSRTTEEILKSEFGQKLKDKGVCYVRCLTDRSQYTNDASERHTYNHWQQSFGTDSMEEAQRKAEDRGLRVEWVTDPLGRQNYMVTKYYAPAFEYCPYSDTNQLYSSVADDFMWFDSWPGVTDLPIPMRPLLMTFGDDSHISYDERQLYVDAYDKFGIPIKWEKGDVAVMCNYRWAHGRPAYDLAAGERRELGVVLGKGFPRIGHVPGKWMDGIEAAE